MIVGEFGTYTSGDLLDANATKELIDASSFIIDGYINVDDELYKIKDEKAYPISHPDISTQPSILPQRFGNLDMKEILVAHGRESDIPNNATVISAWSFNKDACAPACVKKTNGIWQISNRESLTPDFTLVLYVENYNGNNDYYYYAASNN